MTEKEKEFIRAWNAMLKAAKEMEKEGNIKTDFGFTLKSNMAYTLGRQKVANQMDAGFLDNEYTI